MSNTIFKSSINILEVLHSNNGPLNYSELSRKTEKSYSHTKKMTDKLIEQGILEKVNVPGKAHDAIGIKRVNLVRDLVLEFWKLKGLESKKVGNFEYTETKDRIKGKLGDQEFNISKEDK